MRFHRSGWVAAIAALATLAGLGSPRDARAAAEVHKLNLVLSARPTHIDPASFNGFLENYNNNLTARGVQPLDQISFAWLFEGEVRYFLRSNVAVVGGVGQLRTTTKREVLPGLQQDVQIRAEVLSVPIHIGGDYYFSPYNQGDFQARAYMGAGILSQVYNRGRLQQTASGFDPTVVPTFFKVSGQGDSPGYYVETGAHMFFATRFSVLLGVMFRSAKIRDMRGSITVNDVEVPSGRLFDMDTSGVGAIFALGIGL